jgi:uncharacterized protein (DUF3820 family)
MESKYRYRNKIGAILGDVPGEYWKNRDKAFLHGGVPKKIDGKWKIVKQEREENPNIADQYNTITKMAVKRALVASALMLGASDIFTQDIEEMKENEKVIEGEAEFQDQEVPAEEKPAPEKKKSFMQNKPESKPDSRKPENKNPGNKLHFKVGENEIVPIGKFKGKKFSELPGWYLEWLYLNCDTPQDVMPIIYRKIVDGMMEAMKKLGVGDDYVQNIMQEKFGTKEYEALNYEQRKALLSVLKSEAEKHEKK